MDGFVLCTHDVSSILDSTHTHIHNSSRAGGDNLDVFISARSRQRSKTGQVSVLEGPHHGLLSAMSIGDLFDQKQNLLQWPERWEITTRSLSVVIQIASDQQELIRAVGDSVPYDYYG